MVHGSRFRGQASGLRVRGSGSRVQSSGCRVQGSGFRVQGPGFRVGSDLIGESDGADRHQSGTVSAPKLTGLYRIPSMSTYE